MHRLSSILFPCALVLVSSSFTHSQDKVVGGKDRVNFAEVGIAISKPKGFTKAESFHGFQQEATSASVMLTGLPAPFAKAAEGFTSEKFAARQMKLLSTKNIQINGQSGMLLSVSQQAYGQQFQKWMVVFGNAKATKMITATFPESHADSLGDELLKTVLSAITIDTKAPTLPFRIQAAEGLKPVQNIGTMGKMAMFTKTGRIPIESPTDPLLVIAPSIGDIPIEDPKKFATDRIRKIDQARVETISSLQNVTIDGLTGFEIVASAKGKDPSIDLVVYQVCLFPNKGGYILMQGLVGKGTGDAFLTKFREMAQSFVSIKQ